MKWAFQEHSTDVWWRVITKNLNDSEILQKR